MQRLTRQLHLWIGAWGAIAAILFGFTGFVQNHRAVLKLPQGDSTETANIELPVPEAARASPERLRAWLRDAEHVAVDNQRVQPGRPMEFNGQKIRQPGRWIFMGGNARSTIQAEYSVGASSLTVRTSQQSPLAVLGRLHKGAGANMAWILLVDSFALAMMALGISGLIMWARGRRPRQILFSIVGLATLVTLLIGANQIL
jgi:uncharacterized protein